MIPGAASTSAPNLTGEKMNNCKTCKHWHFTGNEPAFFVKDCETAGFKLCAKIFDGSKIDAAEAPADTLAFTFDSEGLHSGIITKADFGCNLFEAAN
jgi:hypothetical protein